MEYYLISYKQDNMLKTALISKEEKDNEKTGFYAFISGDYKNLENHGIITIEGNADYMLDSMYVSN